MKKYEKPSIIIVEELAEGVYAASGSDCMSVKAYISQNPSQNPEGKFVVWVESNHDKSLYGGDGHTATITLAFSGDTANAGTKFWGQIYISSEPGLALTSSTITCHPVY